MRLSRRSTRAGVALLAVAGAALIAAGPAAATAGTAGPAHAGRTGRHPNSVPPAVAKLARRLTAALRHDHYQVARGYLKLYTNADCPYSYRVMKSCYANNPAAPYILPVLPSWPDEYVDPATVDAFGPTRPHHSVSFRFAPREADLIFGVLPPPARYFGIQSYLFTQQGTFDRSSPAYRFMKKNYPGILHIFFAKVPGNPGRIQSLSSLSNSINNVVIKRQSGAAFGTTRFFLITPDRTMNAVVRTALRRLGVRGRHVFTEPVPPLGSPVGLGKRADDFVTLLRYAMPRNEAAGQSWRRRLPLVVLRIRATTSRRPVRPYPPLKLDRRTAAPEGWLKGDLAALATAVCQRWRQCPGQPVNLADLQSPPFSLVGPDCRAIGMNCLADTQDTTYLATPGDLRLDSGQVYAMVSTLATQTGNATYVGLSVTETSRLLGVANVGDPTLTGTAGMFAARVHHTGKLFVYYLARNCAGLGHLTDGHCLSITRKMVPPGGSFKIILRDYIRPGTERGPDSARLLPPEILTFTRPGARFP